MISRLLLIVFLLPLQAALAATKLSIVVGNHPVERYAAEELAKYARALGPISPRIVDATSAKPRGATILLGSPATNRHVADLAANLDWGSLAADGFLLRTVPKSREVLIVGGGLPRATLFGVYELLERWGMRFSLTEDIFPETAWPLRLAPFDERCEPAYAMRAMRPLNNLPEGSAPWDVSDFKRFIDQMAKLKYNTYVFAIMESGPWLDYTFRGSERPAGDIFYGWRFRIEDDFVGKQLFGRQREFYNPVLAQARTEAERKQLGIGLVRAVIDHCRDRGLMSLLTFGFLEPPTAFKRKMNQWATLPLPDPTLFPKARLFETPVEEFGTDPKHAAWMNVLDPAVKELTKLRLRALVDTYPKADFYYLGASEFRAGVVDYREIFKRLDARYKLTPEFDLDRELANPRTFPYGLERYQDQLKGDLLFLYLFDELFVQDRILEGGHKPEGKFMLAGITPELWPLVARIMPRGMYFSDFLEYGTHATADRIDDILPVLKARIPTTLEIGIHDDNSMWFPQVNVESLERIVRTTAPLDLHGYVVALWQIRQADINAAYLARASWKPNVTATEFYHDYLARLVGPRAASDFEQAQRLLEKADHDIKKNLYGFAFAFPTTIPGKLKGVNRKVVARIRSQFQAAMAPLHRARANATKAGRARIDFWLKRTEFGIQWLDLGVEVADLGKLIGSSSDSRAALTAKQKDNALAAADQVLSHSRELIEIIVSDASHIGDLGQIAALNHYVYRRLKELRSDLAKRPVSHP